MYNYSRTLLWWMSVFQHHETQNMVFLSKSVVLSVFYWHSISWISLVFCLSVFTSFKTVEIKMKLSWWHQFWRQIWIWIPFIGEGQPDEKHNRISVIIWYTYLQHLVVTYISVLWHTFAYIWKVDYFNMLHNYSNMRLICVGERATYWC